MILVQWQFGRGSCNFNLDNRQEGRDLGSQETAPWSGKPRVTLPVWMKQTQKTEARSSGDPPMTISMHAIFI